jgi:FkbH-like protein
MNSDLVALRDNILSSLANGEVSRARQHARRLLEQDCAIRQISFIHNALKGSHGQNLSLIPFKVALLSSFSVEFLQPFLAAHGFVNGLDISVYNAGFGQFRQEILDERSQLYAFAPDAVVLAIEGCDLAPQIYRDYLDMAGEASASQVATLRSEIKALLKVFRGRSSATLLVHNFVPPVWKRLGVLDDAVDPGQVRLIHDLNAGLCADCHEHAGAYVVDYCGLVSKHGALHWYDERMKHYARAPIAASMLSHLVREYMKYFRALTGQTKKCLVVDLDNTLWGGVLGEEGIHGIQLGPQYPGSAYVAFQQEILNLHKRGVLLAVASKNNPDDVQEVFAQHRHMALRQEHFSEFQVHWKPKSESLREIAQRLNIGLEHVVFVDDDRAECQQVADTHPEVTVLPLPKEPENFITTLLEDGWFDSLSFSSEDKRREELYRQRQKGEELRKQSASLEDFYRSLAMEVTLSPVTKESLARAAQLTQKTNQFNLTTRRHSETTLSERMDDPDWILTTLAMRDRFGDHGIVGLIMARIDSTNLEIDTFLLSCRVIGRTAETAMLAYLNELALQRNLRRIRGSVIPTAKNLPARDLFQRHGFAKIDEQDSGVTLWTLDFDRQVIPYPEWIRVTAPDRAPCAVRS